MGKLITGVLPALVTPMDADGNVLVGLADKLVDFYESEEADGLYMLGWTGEGMYLPVQKRKLWAEAVLKAARGRMPVFVHVGYNANLDDSVELARHAAGHGAYAVASVGISPSSTLAENVAYFKRISGAAPKIPFYIYWTSNGQSLTGGARVDPDELLAAMREVPTFKGIKFTDNDFYLLERFKKHDPDINILTGADSLAICSRLMGADGNIGALQAITCYHYKEMMRLMDAGDLKAARALQFRANNIAEAYSVRGIGTMNGIKLALDRIYGIPVGYCSPTSPFLREVDETLAEQFLEAFRANILRKKGQ
jgi:dihydrodipicolinate synthase/N-acetylneuraminate lyase